MELAILGLSPVGLKDRVLGVCVGWLGASLILIIGSDYSRTVRPIPANPPNPDTGLLLDGILLLGAIMEV